MKKIFSYMKFYTCDVCFENFCRLPHTYYTACKNIRSTLLADIKFVGGIAYEDWKNNMYLSYVTSDEHIMSTADPVYEDIIAEVKTGCDKQVIETTERIELILRAAHSVLLHVEQQNNNTILPLQDKSWIPLPTQMSADDIAVMASDMECFYYKKLLGLKNHYHSQHIFNNIIKEDAVKWLPSKLIPFVSQTRICGIDISTTIDHHYEDHNNVLHFVKIIWSSLPTKKQIENLEYPHFALLSYEKEYITEFWQPHKRTITPMKIRQAGVEDARRSGASYTYNDSTTNYKEPSEIALCKRSTVFDVQQAMQSLVDKYIAYTHMRQVF